MTYRILCYGDSNTFGFIPAGYGKRWDKRWTRVLAQALPAGYEVIEEGCSGRTTDIDSPAEPWKNGFTGLRISLSSHKPIDMIIVMLGTNDLKSDFHRNAHDIAEGMKKVVIDMQEYLQEKQGFSPRILLMSPPHLDKDVENKVFGHDFSLESVCVSEKLAEEYRKIAEERDCLFLDASLFVKASDKDGIHLEEEEHGKLADAVFQKLKETIM